MELLLALACLNGKGCTETSQAYSYYNKDLVANIQNYVDNYKSKYPTAMNYTIPYTAALLYGQGSIYLQRGISLEIKEYGIYKALVYTKGF